MLRYKLVVLAICLYAVAGYSQKKEMIVLQMNIWQEGTMVKGGFDAIADEVARLEPDIVMFSEVRNYQGKQFIPRMLQALDDRGKKYYGESSTLDVGILSKYEIFGQTPNCPQAKDGGSVLKAKINFEGRTVVIYSAHLDYTHYACYLPRGYNGVTWKKMDAPVLDALAIEKANNESLRDEAILHVIEDARSEEGNIIILGGDFNEPSHLDWKENTKNLWDHNGVVVRWDCSVLLSNAGFKDAYRVKYPNPVTHPGFTFPSDNEGVPVEKLSWAPEADERDRIDFIYFVPDKRLKLEKIAILGPDRSIVRGKRVKEEGKDWFIEPISVWPTDHKAILATFRLK